MVSVPNTVSSYDVKTLFPSALTHAFSFEGGYVVKETLVNGAGYWVKLAAVETLSLAGGQRLSDTIDVVAGWNMIGSISVPIQTTSLVEIPSGITGSPLFAFEGSYVRADILAPGYGYWIKANAPGKLVLSATLPATPRATDTQRGTDILVGQSLVDADGDLPPPPPGEEPLSSHLPPQSHGPDHFELRGNYPNPFNPWTTFSVDIPRISEVRIGISDVLGREIIILLNGQESPGTLQLRWDGRDYRGLEVPAGVYFVRMSAEGFTASRKLLLLR